MQVDFNPIDSEPMITDFKFRDGGWLAYPYNKYYTAMHNNQPRDGKNHWDQNGTALYYNRNITLTSPWSRILESKKHLYNRPYRCVKPWFEEGKETPHLTGLVGLYNHEGEYFGIVQTEDVYYEGTRELMRGAIGRVGLVKTYSPLTLRGYNWVNPNPDFETYGKSWSPILEHWQTDDELVPDHSKVSDPESRFFGIVGVAVSSIIDLNDYVYMFYTRFTNTARYDNKLGGFPTYGFPPFLGRQVPPPPTDFGPKYEEAWKKYNQRFNGICLARMHKDSLLVEKYYEPWPIDADNISFDGEEWYEILPTKKSGLWNPIYSTKIIPDGSYPHVHYNSYLKKFVMVCQGNATNSEQFSYLPKTLWYTSENLIDWESHGVFYDFGEWPTFYPTICNEDGTSTYEAGQDAYFIWQSPDNGSRNRSHRVRIKFS